MESEIQFEVVYGEWLGFPGRSAGKESTCNARYLSLIPGWGRCPGEGIDYPLQYSWAFLVAQLVKKSTCNVGDLGSIPGLERSFGGGQGNPLQYSCLENPRGMRRPGGLQSMGLQRVRHNQATKHSTSEWLANYGP